MKILYSSFFVCVDPKINKSNFFVKSLFTAGSGRSSRCHIRRVSGCSSETQLEHSSGCKPSKGIILSVFFFTLSDQKGLVLFCRCNILLSQVEQLFRLGLRSRAECEELLQSSQWNLEEASLVMLDTYRPHK